MATRPPPSPSKSPTGRLPSPPPIAEDQSAPQSPHLASSEDQIGHGATGSNQGASRRIRPGAKASEMAGGPPLVDLSDIDSPFQLTEHLKSLHYSFTNPDPQLTQALSKEHAVLLSQPPNGIDRSLWLYELCRFLVQKVNSVIVALFSDAPACSSQTCPEMRASEWQYLCAVHDPPKACCAIDYCCHTLDWAANTLTSPKHFPSRLSLGTENTAPQHQVRQLTNIFRRVYRIFAHAWFSHREMFWRIEGRTGLYIFFKTVCDNYNLIPEDNYTIPPEAEGKEPVDSSSAIQQAQQPVLSIVKRGSDADAQSNESLDDPNQAPGLMPSATARRHRHSPSKGAPVGTVMEENEDDEEEKGLLSDVPPPPMSVPILPPLAPPSLMNGSEEESPPGPGLARSATQIHASSRSPILSSTSSVVESAPTLAESAPEPTIEVEVRPLTTTDSPPPDSHSGKSFSDFSPASPKASTMEELELQKSESQKPTVSEEAAVVPESTATTES